MLAKISKNAKIIIKISNINNQKSFIKNKIIFKITWKVINKLIYSNII